MMAKQTDWATQVYKHAGAKPKEPTYQFGRKEFKQNPQPPGEHSNNVDSNKKI
jgi:hypothetical protein